MNSQSNTYIKPSEIGRTTKTFESDTDSLTAEEQLHPIQSQLSRTDTDNNKLRSLAAAIYLSFEELTSTKSDIDLLNVFTYEVESEARKQNAYVAKLVSTLKRLDNFQYQPGHNNSVRKLVFDNYSNQSVMFIDAIQRVLRDSSYLLDEDIQLELIDTLGELDEIESRQTLVHLLIYLLRSESDAIVDSAVSALSPDGLTAKNAVPYLQKLAAQTTNTFLKNQTLNTLELLENS